MNADHMMLPHLNVVFLGNFVYSSVMEDERGRGPVLKHERNKLTARFAE